MNSLLTDPNFILESDDDEFEYVDVPQWGGRVRVRSIGAKEREDLLQTSIVIDSKTGARTLSTPKMRVEIVWLAVVDEQGNRVFTGRDQLKALGKKNASAIDLVADVAMRLAGINDDTKDADEDDAGKDSPATSDAGSASA